MQASQKTVLCLIGKNSELKRSSEPIQGCGSLQPSQHPSYQVRVAGRIFSGTDARTLIRLAVAAKRRLVY